MSSKLLYAHLIASRFSAALAAVPTVTLNNGVEMPMMSLGTGVEYKINNATATEISVRMAMQGGWTAVDTALSYNNEEGVGRALAEVERSSVFLITKIGGEDYVDVASAYNHSLDQAYKNLDLLNFDYVDLVLLHQPANPNGGFSTEDACSYAKEQWRALEDFTRLGKARAIGVANYCMSDLSCILETATVVPAVNQLLFHAGMGPDPRGLVSYNDMLGIKTMAYEPLGSIDFDTQTRDNTLITGSFTNGIGKPYNKSGAQVALRWLIQHGIPLATSSSSEKHLLENLEVFEFSLNGTDMQKLDGATTPAGEPNHYWADIPLCDSTAFAVTV